MACLLLCLQEIFRNDACVTKLKVKSQGHWGSPRSFGATLNQVTRGQQPPVLWLCPTWGTSKPNRTNWKTPLCNLRNRACPVRQHCLLCYNVGDRYLWDRRTSLRPPEAAGKKMWEGGSQKWFLWNYRCLPSFWKVFMYPQITAFITVRIAFIWLLEYTIIKECFIKKSCTF